MEITIAHLYPEILNLSADKGNILALKERSAKRNIGLVVKEYKLTDEIDFDSSHIILLGGGLEKDKISVSKRLIELKEKINEFLSKGGIILAVSTSFPILGKTFETNGEKYEGLGLIDMFTVSERKRKIGNVILKSEKLGCMIAGFENHTDKTIFEDGTTNLGEIIFGSDKGEMEGVITDNIIGTHLHGPILPKNPELTDYVIKKALEKEGTNEELAEIDSSYEENAKRYIVNRLLN